jgi:hypothetical protein
LFPRHKFRKYEVVRPASVKPASGEVVGPASEPISDHDFCSEFLDDFFGGNDGNNSRREAINEDIFDEWFAEV